MSKYPFNIFQVAGIWKSEEIHTSIIAELINPQSDFYDKGAVFLEKFLNTIDPQLAQVIPFEELQKAEVKTEEPTNDGRRIDMVIDTENYYLPFEIKIWAGDQDRQLWDYYKFAGEQGKNVPKIYYLTPDRHAPSERSRISSDGNRLNDHQVCQLTFQEHILPWLVACKGESNVSPGVLEVIKQLNDNIQGAANTQIRPGIQGFSKWSGEVDILSDIYRELSTEYALPWTECTNSYMTFTLNKIESLEFALRIHKENEDQVRLYLICGVTGEDGKPNYASAGDYIAGNHEEFDKLLKATFTEDGKMLELKTNNSWNRLPDSGYRHLGKKKCCQQIEKIFENLQDPPRQSFAKK